MRELRLAKPAFSAGDIREISRDVAAILESGWLTTGRYASELEARFRATAKTRHAVAVNSGTAALHIMMASLHLKPGDEVVVPANTFASTATAVLYEGARPVLADCDQDTFNVRAPDVEAAVTRSTKAVLVTHIAGNPCEMDAIAKLCEDRGLPLFEDAAHALGSTYERRPCGSLGAGGAFSLYPTKVITSAEGGVLTTDSTELADFARLYRNMGRRALGAGPIEILGHNYRMSDVHAAIGLNQMKHLTRFVERRNQLAALYSQALRRHPWLRPQVVHDHSTSCYYCYIVRLSDESPISRDALAERLKKRGIETTVMFRPLGSQPFFRGLGARDCPGADVVGRDTLVLPLYVGMTRGDVNYVVSSIGEAAAE